MRLYHTATHNMAEGAGAAALAALMAERDHQTGRRVAVILCGGNVDRDIYRQVLAGETPRPFA
jgi:threonine dehydratase